jgi:hypothetical protein
MAMLFHYVASGVLDGERRTIAVPRMCLSREFQVLNG